MGNTASLGSKKVNTPTIKLSAIKQAIINEDIKTIEKLLKKGVNPNDLGPDKQTCLHYALQSELPRFKIIKLLLQHKADPNVQNHLGNTCLQALFETFLKIDSECNNDYMLPSHALLDVVKLLLKYQANPNIKNKNNETPIHYACQLTNKELLLLLIQHKADLNIQSDILGYPLHYVYQAEKKEFFNLLLLNNVETQVVDHEGNTILHLAIKKHDLDGVEKLLAKNMNLNAENKQKDTCLTLLHQYLLTQNYPSLKLFKLMLLCLINGAQCSNIPIEKFAQDEKKYDKYEYLAIKLIEFCKVAEQKNSRFMLCHLFEKQGVALLKQNQSNVDESSSASYQVILGQEPMINTIELSNESYHHLKSKVNQPLMLWTLLNAKPRLPRRLAIHILQKEGVDFIDIKKMTSVLHKDSFYHFVQAIRTFMKQDGYNPALLLNSNVWQQMPEGDLNQQMEIQDQLEEALKNIRYKISRD